MDRLPSLSWKKLVRILSKVGFYIHHQTGSHIVLKRDQPYCRVVVPAHRTIKRGLLRTIIRETGMTRDEFLELLG